MSAELLLAFILGIIGGILLTVIVIVGIFRKLVNLSKKELDNK